MLIPLAAMRDTLSALRGRMRFVTALAAVHIIGPFLLITSGETHITSSLTGILIAIEPVVIALLMARSEPITGIRTAGLVTYVNPVVAALLGVALLHEPVGAGTVAGFLLIVAGCWLSTRPTRTHADKLVDAR